MLNQKCVYGSLEIVGRSVRLSFLKAWALSVMGTRYKSNECCCNQLPGKRLQAVCALHIPPCSYLLVLKPFPGFSVHKRHGWDLQQFCSCLWCGGFTPGFTESSLGSKHRVMWLEVRHPKLMVRPSPESQLCQKGLWQCKSMGR